ncbi:hypothetical protein [Novosphingobium sp.]|uniref:hypothetical protein n=1 Tax=Novosphingobium sp. TaxID=1874826 RepID=UPI003D6C7146
MTGMEIAVAIISLVGGAFFSVLVQHWVDSRSREVQARRQSSTFDTLDFNGAWIAIWQTKVDGRTSLDHETINITQCKNRLFLHNEARSEDNPEGGYLWTGELTIWDNKHLLGYYVARESNVLSKGVFYFTLHYGGNLLQGGWIGCSYDGDPMAGSAVMAKTRERADEAMSRLQRSNSVIQISADE